MKSYQFISACALIAATAGFAAPAMATPSESFTLDTWQGSTPESGPFGTVTLNAGSTYVDVDVTLASGDGFVNTGAGDSLDFYLANTSGPITSIQITGLTTGFTALNTTAGVTSDGSYSAGGAKGFNYAIHCNACDSGGSNVYTGSLDFAIGGVTLADFLPSPGKNGGFYFASDICDGTSGTSPVTCGGTPGQTGPVTAEFDARSVSVPEPFTLSLFGAGLGGVAALRRRAKKKA